MKEKKEREEGRGIRWWNEKSRGGEEEKEEEKLNLWCYFVPERPLHCTVYKYTFTNRLSLLFFSNSNVRCSDHVWIHHGWLGGTSGWEKLTTSCADTSQGGCVSLEMFWISLNFYFWAGQLTLVICNISSQGGINDWTDAWVSQKTNVWIMDFFLLPHLLIC